jgi:hypothetical protein
MFRSEITYDTSRRVADRDRTLDHCEHGWYTLGVLTAYDLVQQPVIRHTRPMYRAVKHQIELDLEELLADL